MALRENHSNIFRDVFVRLVSVHYVFYISLQGFMTCGQSVKKNEFSFVSYCILYFDNLPITRAQICSLINHSLPGPLIPDPLLRNSYSPISNSPRLLAPLYLACSHPPGPCYSGEVKGKIFRAR